MHLNTWGSIYPTSKKYFLYVQSIKYFAPRYLGAHISNLYMQGIQYFALKYLGVHLSNLEKILLARAKYSIFCTYILWVHVSNFEKIILARAKYSILCTLIHGGPYIQLHKNTSCTCKVFNTLHLNTWRSIYPTSNKYFLHVQSIQYFAPE